MLGSTLRLLSACFLLLVCLAPAVMADDKKKDACCEYCPLKVCDCAHSGTVSLSKPRTDTAHASLPAISDRHVTKYVSVEQPAQSQEQTASCSQGSCPAPSQTTYVSSPTAYQGQPEFRESRRSRKGSRGSRSCGSGGCG